MHAYKADIHIHTVLSPCGDVEMSPVNIVNTAVKQNLNIIGITDHNSTKHCKLIKDLAQKKDIFVLRGAEVNTKEEIHCLAFFETTEKLNSFQQYLDFHLNKVKNLPERFGYQLVVDEFDNVIEEENYLLISSINQSVDQLEQKVHELGGIFIPAHIDRQRYSFTSQLGFVPQGIKADALEISCFTTKAEMVEKFPYLNDYRFIRNSDAHFIEQIGKHSTMFKIKNLSFEEIKKALNGKDGRDVLLNNE